MAGPETHLDRSRQSPQPEETKHSLDPVRASLKDAQHSPASLEDTRRSPERSPERDVSSDVPRIKFRVGDEEFSLPGRPTEEAYNKRAEEAHKRSEEASNERLDWLGKWNEEHPEKQIDYLDFSNLFTGGKDGSGCAAIGNLTNMTVLSREIPGIENKDIPPYKKGYRRIADPDGSVDYLSRSASDQEIFKTIDEWNKKPGNINRKLFKGSAISFRQGTKERSTTDWFNLDAHLPHSELIGN